MSGSIDTFFPTKQKPRREGNMKKQNQKEDRSTNNDMGRFQTTWAYRNSEGYSDPTAGAVLDRIYREELLRLRKMQEGDQKKKEKAFRREKKVPGWKHEVSVVRYYSVKGDSSHES